MKITFILPAIGKKPGEKYIKTWRKMEPLVISTLKALTPQDVETEFYDDRLEQINYDTRTDLVAISLEMYTARRAYIIADKFRSRGVKVILGGYHVSLCPDEAQKHADSILIGNAEHIWENIVRDFEKGTFDKRYHGVHGINGTLPDRSILQGKNYTPIGLVETGRGCNFNCEFCSITACYKAKYHLRDINSVIRDIEKAEKKFFFFVDDNIVANPQYALDLFKAIAPLNIRWSAQGTLTMAKNPEMLKWMKKSGCDVILIGYESIEPENLRQMNKTWSLKLGERDELTRKIHDAGIGIYATFVFGFDYDTPEVIDRTVDFALKHDFFFAAFNHLLPFPGTSLYDRMIKEKRMLRDSWWLEPDYLYGHIPFLPKNMSPEELSQRCADARRSFFKYSNILKRSLSLLKRNFDPFLYAIFLSQNINLRREVETKLGLPLGSGLDEYPK